ncbi:MAG: triple tyrosine motif-containing protein [Bacteroidota bacterium]
MQRGDTIWDESRNNYYNTTTLPANTGYLADNHIRYDSLSALFKLPLGLQLPYNQNSLNFSYSNSNIIGRDKVVYRYILEGDDKNWSDITDKTITKNYYNLSPGQYTFKVRSKGMNDIWGIAAELHFTILPPWWQTWWAYILYALIFSGAVWFIGLYRSRWLKEENRVLEDKVSLRTAQLKQTIEELKGTQSQLVQSEKMASLGELTAGIAHEIQNPLNFVNNFSEVNSELITEMNQEIDNGNFEEVKNIAKDISENEQKIIFHGKRADAIVKGMLQHSRSSNGVKELTNINALADEYLRLAYHGLRAKDKSFNATMKTDFDENIGNVNIVSQDMGRVILNLITNAFYAVTEKKKQYSPPDSGE